MIRIYDDQGNYILNEEVYHYSRDFPETEARFKEMAYWAKHYMVDDALTPFYIKAE